MIHTEVERSFNGNDKPRKLAWNNVYDNCWKALGVLRYEEFRINEFMRLCALLKQYPGLGLHDKEFKELFKKDFKQPE
jgi:hypothetical protein